MTIVPPEQHSVNTASQTIPYEHMSKSDLIDIAYRQQSLIQRFYKTLATSNSKASLGEKVAWLVAKPLIAQQTPNEQGLVRFPIDDVAEAMGMSESSVSRYVAQPCERFDLTRESIPYTTKAGQKCNLVFINPEEPYWTDLESAPLPEDAERKINGNGKCRCGGTIHKTRRVLTYQEIHECDRCGEKLVFPVKETKHSPLPEGLQPGNLSTEEQEPENLQSLTSTNTPPIVEVKKVSSLESFLLESIGNPEQKLIQSTGKSDDDAKYISLPLDHQLDLEKYLAGDLAHIYGSGLADKDGMTYQLDFDIDKQEEYAPHEQYQKELARAGISSLLFHRAYADKHYKAHLKVRFSEKVNAEAGKAHCLAACPKLAQIEECYPTGGKHNGRISWPLWHRRGDTVTACPVDIVLASAPDEVIHHLGIKAQPNSLPWLIERAINDASLVPALPVVEQPATAGGVLLDTPLPMRPASFYNDGLRAIILPEYDKLPWHEVVQGEIKNGRFSLRKEDHKPSTVIQGKYATDYGRTASGKPECHDKFDVYWLSRGKNPRDELRRLCDELKQRQNWQVAS